MAGSRRAARPTPNRKGEVSIPIALNSRPTPMPNTRPGATRLPINSANTILSPGKRLRKAIAAKNETTTVIAVTAIASLMERSNAPLTSPVLTCVNRSTNQCSDSPFIGNTRPPRTSWNDRM